MIPSISSHPHALAHFACLRTHPATLLALEVHHSALSTHPPFPASNNLTRPLACCLPPKPSQPPLPPPLSRSRIHVRIQPSPPPTLLPNKSCNKDLLVCVRRPGPSTRSINQTKLSSVQTLTRQRSTQRIRTFDHSGVCVHGRACAAQDILNLTTLRGFQ